MPHVIHGADQNGEAMTRDVLALFSDWPQTRPLPKHNQQATQAKGHVNSEGHRAIMHIPEGERKLCWTDGKQRKCEESNSKADSGTRKARQKTQQSTTRRCKARERGREGETHLSQRERAKYASS